MRVLLSDEALDKILEHQTNNLNITDDLDPKIIELIREVVPTGTGEVVIVPVLAREHKDKGENHLNFIR